MVAGFGLLFGIGTPLSHAAHVASAALFGLRYGLVYPLIQAQAVNGTGDPALRDAALTWFVASYFVGLFGFPFLGGWIVVHLGAQPLIAAIVTLGLAELAIGLAVRRDRSTGLRTVR